MGSLYKRGKLYWYAYYKDGKRYRKSLKTQDRETAKYLASKITQDVVENKYINYEVEQNCQKVLVEYKEASQFHKVAKTNKDDFSRIKAFLSYSGVTTLNQVTERKFQDYLNHRLNADKITLNTANRIIASVKAWLNFAVRRKYILINPLKDFKKYRSPQNPPKFLPKGEVEKIIVAAKESPLYPAVMTALYTGMRKKELATLDWPDVDFEGNVITVRNKDGFLTKSKKFRVVPLHNFLKGLLLPLKRSSGRCFNMVNHRKLLPAIIKKAGLKGIGWHHFRHTFASHLALQGVDLYTIAQILGHSDISVTQIYAHLTKDHIKSAVEKLNF